MLVGRDHPAPGATTSNESVFVKTYYTSNSYLRTGIIEAVLVYRDICIGGAISSDSGLHLGATRPSPISCVCNLTSRRDHYTRLPNILRRNDWCEPTQINILFYKESTTQCRAKSGEQTIQLRFDGDAVHAMKRKEIA